MRSSTRTWSPFSLLTAVLLLQSASCADTPVAPTASSSITIGVAHFGVKGDELLMVTVDGRDHTVFPTTGLVLIPVLT